MHGYFVACLLLSRAPTIYFDSIFLCAAFIRVHDKLKPLEETNECKYELFVSRLIFVHSQQNSTRTINVFIWFRFQASRTISVVLQLCWLFFSRAIRLFFKKQPSRGLESARVCVRDSDRGRNSTEREECYHRTMCGINSNIRLPPALSRLHRSQNKSIN